MRIVYLCADRGIPLLGAKRGLCPPALPGRSAGAPRERNQLFDDEEARRHLGRTAWARSRTLSWDRVAWRVERVLGGGAQAA